MFERNALAALLFGMLISVVAQVRLEQKLNRILASTGG